MERCRLPGFPGHSFRGCHNSGGISGAQTCTDPCLLLSSWAQLVARLPVVLSAEVVAASGSSSQWLGWRAGAGSMASGLCWVCRLGPSSQHPAACSFLVSSDAQCWRARKKPLSFFLISAIFHLISACAGFKIFMFYCTFQECFI